MWRTSCWVRTRGGPWRGARWAPRAPPPPPRRERERLLFLLFPLPFSSPSTPSRLLEPPRRASWGRSWPMRTGMEGQQEQQDREGGSEGEGVRRGRGPLLTPPTPTPRGRQPLLLQSGSARSSPPCSPPCSMPCVRLGAALRRRQRARAPRRAPRRPPRPRPSPSSRRSRAPSPAAAPRRCCSLPSRRERPPPCLRLGGSRSAARWSLAAGP